MSNLYCFFVAIWRRIYGEGSIEGIWGNRTVQAAIYIICTTLLYTTNPYSWQCWLLSFIVSIWLYAQFFSRAVGEFIDLGESTTQGRDSYDRWFRGLLNSLYSIINHILKLIGSDKQLKKYYGMYDFWYCEMRYTFCLLPMCIFSWWYLIPGLLSAPIYWICGWLYKNYPQLYLLPKWLDDSKNMAELLLGFSLGLTCQLVRWGI